MSSHPTGSVFVNMVKEAHFQSLLDVAGEPDAVEREKIIATLSPEDQKSIRNLHQSLYTPVTWFHSHFSRNEISKSK